MSKQTELVGLARTTNLDEVNAAYSAGALSNRNILINNDFRIWQRGTVFYGGSNSWSYTTDRWQAGWTAITEKITGGLKMTIGSSTVGNQLFQIIENIDNALQRNFDTYTATIKFKAPVGVTVELYVKNWGNGWSDLFSGSVAATGNEQTFTISGPSSGLVSGGNPYFNMIFNGATTGQVIEVYDTQLEGGSQATPFEHRSYGQELALCQRYYEDIWVNGVAMNAYGGTASAYGFTLFKVQKRTSPTMVYYTDIPNYGCHRHTGAENAGLFWNNVGSRPDGVSFRYARGAGNWPSDADCVHAYCHKSADAEL
jgi:hypothetical protein